MIFNTPPPLHYKPQRHTFIHTLSLYGETHVVLNPAILKTVDPPH